MRNKNKSNKVRVIGLMVAIMKGAKVRFTRQVDRMPVSVASNVQTIDIPTDFYGILKGTVKFTEEDIEEAKKALARGMGSRE